MIIGDLAGMLAAWMRIKYPSAVDGAIAASAPILAFEGQGFDSEAYWQVVTRSKKTRELKPTSTEENRIIIIISMILFVVVF